MHHGDGSFDACIRGTVLSMQLGAGRAFLCVERVAFEVVVSEVLGQRWPFGSSFASPGIGLFSQIRGFPKSVRIF